MKNTVASAILSMLFVATLFIYLLAPNNVTVLALGVTILAVSVIVAFIGGWREVAVLSAVTLLISTVAAYLFSREMLGPQLAWCLPILFWFGLVGMGWLLWRRTLQVPIDQVAVIHRVSDGTFHTRPAGLALPPMPLLEEIVAYMPAYEMRTVVPVSSLNTQSMYNVSKVEVQVFYRLAEPARVFVAYPNRILVLQKVAKELGADQDKAALTPSFWEKVFDHQIKEDVDNVLRDVIYSQEGIGGPVDVYKKRDEIGAVLRTELPKICATWGMKVENVEVENVELEKERVDGFYRDRKVARENEENELKAKRDAIRIRTVGQAEAEVEAELTSRMLQSIVGVLTEQQTGLSVEEIRQIVLNVIETANERRRNADFLRAVHDNAGPGAPEPRKS